MAPRPARDGDTVHTEVGGDLRLECRAVVDREQSDAIVTSILPETSCHCFHLSITLREFHLLTLGSLQIRCLNKLSPLEMWTLFQRSIKDYKLSLLETTCLIIYGQQKV